MDKTSNDKTDVKPNDFPWWFNGKFRLDYVNLSPNKDPEYECEDDSCFDVRVWVDPKLYPDFNVKTNEKGVDYITLQPGKTMLFHTGWYFKIPPRGLELQTRSRSGLSLDCQIIVRNSPGTIDQGYRGELMVIITNAGEEDFDIKNSERPAQCGLYPVLCGSMVELNKVERIEQDTDRAAQGIGHSGIE